MNATAPFKESSEFMQLKDITTYILSSSLAALGSG
jgi:hypothetical protein